MDLSSFFKWKPPPVPDKVKAQSGPGGGEDDDGPELEEVYRGGQVGGSKRACEDAFDKWVTCLVASDCFKGKSPGTNAQLKECAKTGASGVPEECVNMLSYVRLCRRSQVDMRKRFVGKPT
eukprot:SAG22_NODE_39_length_26283_cov_18.486653_3_plen_121_part_00